MMVIPAYLQLIEILLCNLKQMSQTTIRFLIDSNGNVDEQVEGVMGYSCDKLTKPIEEALGTVVAHTHTPEYFKTLPESKRLEYLEDHDWL